MLNRKATVTISFNVSVLLEEREGHWAAYIEPLGTTVYGDTRAGAEKRVKDALDFFLANAPDVRRYLDSHSIPHFVTEDDSGPVRLTYPVSARIENPAYA